MTLIVVPVLTTQKKDSVHTLGQGILDPDHIHGPQAPDRNKTHIRRISQPIQTGDVKGRIGIIFTNQSQNPQRRFVVIIFRGNADGFYHGTHTVDTVVGKVNDPLGAGSHAGSTSPTARRIGFGCSFFIIVQGPEGALLRAALALGTSLEKEIRIGHVPGAGMNRNPPVN